MAIVLNILWLLVGFVLLIKGADFFVDGSSSLARKLKIPSLVVGLTIVALGTSCPELAVSVSSSLSGANSMAVGNVVGSNLFNLLVVLGVCAAITPVMVSKDVIKRDFPVSIGVMVVFGALLLLGTQKYTQSRLESVILLVLLIGYMIWTVSAALKDRKNAAEEESAEKFVWWKCALFIIGGAAGIVFGGTLVVNNAESLCCDTLGMSETLVGLTVCAIGTSLPELVTSVVAARKGESDMAIGNVVGSNILNVICILGVSGLISPIDVSMENPMNILIDIGIFLVTAILCYIFCLNKKITRAEGVVLVLIYVAYMAYAVLREPTIQAMFA